MSIRQSTVLRSLARRLPVTKRYEQRIQELTDEADALRGRASSGPGGSVTADVDGVALWVPPGHFYSPFPSPAYVRGRTDIFGRDPTDLPGIELRVDAQRKLLDDLEPLVAGIEWPRTQADALARGQRYWADNPAYADGDALFLRALLLHLRPRRLVELGSGYSSACTMDARDDLGEGAFEVTFVDPYPELLRSVLRPADLEVATLLEVGTQDLDVAVIDQLEDGDVLFIDSTHVAKPGGDVNRIIFEILPRIRPGVIVHLHDIFPAFEYPQSWIEELRGWTELYLLRAFLQFNDAFEILLWPGVLRALDPDDVEHRFPAMARNAGGAIWLRRAV